MDDRFPRVLEVFSELRYTRVYDLSFYYFLRIDANENERAYIHTLPVLESYNSFYAVFRKSLLKIVIYKPPALYLYVHNNDALHVFCYSLGIHTYMGIIVGSFVNALLRDWNIYEDFCLSIFVSSRVYKSFYILSFDMIPIAKKKTKKIGISNGKQMHAIYSP